MKPSLWVGTTKRMESLAVKMRKCVDDTGVGVLTALTPSLVLPLVYASAMTSLRATCPRPCGG